MNKLEIFVENFATTSLESTESACIRRSTYAFYAFRSSIDDEAQIASQRFPTVSNVFKTTYYMKEMLYEVRCLKSNEDKILELTGQFKQLSHEPEKFR